MARRFAALLLPALAAACAAPPPACPPGTEAATVSEAYFGRNVRDRAPVSEAEWRAFLADTVTPAFPDGLTALDGRGQWRSREGRILQEDSKVLVLILPGQDAATARARLRPVEEEWKRRFRQQSVLTVHRSACVAF
ncbi:DUF3574 domain-containing protein [Roseomonas sp. PWR1]|uniref:DUF3574 domain-containing protein n=1 Tax=Roseomonas nitratireducens TaxID=2820810 RepID=A0ABS4ATV6_9PROT|nr:DUF3574 domain-containing protein [Neoroseomonas nitratireducens]MBP0464799.1 DUF3574 domain-containing protein [Neoroseomonas nitratireducens]